jgi:regulator of RNase E activity RraB
VGDEAWDFYYGRVDDAPASIFLNFGYQGDVPPGLDTLYYCGLQIADPGEHGMGQGADVDKLWALEDAITAAATAAGFCHVGRLRNGGDWQITLYGVAGKEAELEALVVAALGDAERGYRLGSQPDPDWGYYHDFLLPDPERLQWIMNRRVVEQLAKSGDTHEIARPVDHFIHFADADARDGFIAVVEREGFAADAHDPDADAALPFTVALAREDPVTLQHIHDVVMHLSTLAEQFGGDYDGWGAPIAEPNA